MRYFSHPQPFIFDKHLLKICSCRVSPAMGRDDACGAKAHGLRLAKISRPGNWFREFAAHAAETRAATPLRRGTCFACRKPPQEAAG
jgi:hypothetical protein